MWTRQSEGFSRCLHPQMISFDSYNLLVKRTLKVADSNFLCREELRDYLSERDTNCVVLTDFIAIEMYKNEPNYTARLSLEIISNFPKQAVILKNTEQICRLSGRSAGPTRRMLCPVQNEAFPEWCEGRRMPTLKGHMEF